MPSQSPPPAAVPAPEYLRPAQAAARFPVSESTLRRWADAGLISRSKPGGKARGATFYDAAEITELLASSRTPRKVVSITSPVPASAPPASENWGGFEDWLRRKREDSPRPSRGARRQGR